jgi:hypothetical protein
MAQQQPVTLRRYANGYVLFSCASNQINIGQKAIDTLYFFQKGYSLQQIVTARKVSESTILNDLASLIAENYITLTEVSSVYPFAEGAIEAISQEMLKSTDYSAIRLSPIMTIFENVYPGINFHHLRLIRAECIRTRLNT